MCSKSISEHVGASDAAFEEERTFAPWLTVEVGLYVAIGVVALAMRLAGLGTRPLDSAEATQALGAWTLARGVAPQTTGVSPLLLFGNSLAFMLFAASDAWARIWPALFGTALALSPALLRRWLGRSGALAASVLLTVSPTALYASRYLSGDAAVLFAAVLGLAGSLQFLRDRAARGAVWAAIALALMLSGAPVAWSVVFIAISFIVILAIVRRLGRGGDGWDRLYAGVEELRSTPGLSRALLVWVVVPVLVISTMALTYFAGFQSMVDLFGAWMAQIGGVAGGTPWYYHFLLLLFYEPEILIFGIAGVLMAFTRRDLFSAFLTYWAVVALYAYTLFGGKTATDGLVALVPLALLAGIAIGRLIDGLSADGGWDVEGMFLGVCSPLFVYALLQLASFAESGQTPYVYLFGAASILTALLFAGYWMWVGSGAALRSIALAAAIFLSLSTVGLSWRVNYIAFDSPAEIMLRNPTQREVRDLTHTLARLSAWRAGDPRELQVDVAALDDPVVDWYLKDVRVVRQTDRLMEDPPSPIYVTRADYVPGVMPDGYRGQTFRLRSSWPFGGLQGSDFANWLLYRKLSAQPVSEEVVLWAPGSAGPAATDSR